MRKSEFEEIENDNALYDDTTTTIIRKCVKHEKKKQFKYPESHISLEDTQLDIDPIWFDDDDDNMNFTRR